MSAAISRTRGRGELHGQRRASASTSAASVGVGRRGVRGFADGVVLAAMTCNGAVGGPTRATFDDDDANPNPATQRGARACSAHDRNSSHAQSPPDADLRRARRRVRRARALRLGFGRVGPQSGVVDETGRRARAHRHMDGFRLTARRSSRTPCTQPAFGIIPRFSQAGLVYGTAGTMDTYVYRTTEQAEPPPGSRACALVRCSRASPRPGPADGGGMLGYFGQYRYRGDGPRRAHIRPRSSAACGVWAPGTRVRCSPP
jgi:hypothetical protein